MEEWKRIDFIKWFNLPFMPDKTFEVSNKGVVRSYKDKNKISIIPGTIRKTTNSPPYKYFSLRLKTKAFKIPLAQAVLNAFVPNYEKDKYHVTFIDNDSTNLDLTNIRLILMKSKKEIPHDTLILYETYANNKRLYKIIESILRKRPVIFDNFYSHEDVVQDYMMYLRDKLYMYDDKKYDDFSTFCFFKAYDFIGDLKFKKAKQPLTRKENTISYLEGLGEENGKSSNKVWIEERAVTISDFSYRLSYGYKYLQ